MLISLRLTTEDTEKMFFDYSKCEIQRPEKIQKQIYYSSYVIKTSYRTRSISLRSMSVHIFSLKKHVL
jgi:hypothetical protein